MSNQVVDMDFNDLQFLLSKHQYTKLTKFGLWWIQGCLYPPIYAYFVTF